MGPTSRRGRGILPNLLWLGALCLVIAAIFLVWGQGGKLFAPSRETFVVKVFREASPAVVNISAEPLSSPSGLSLLGEGTGSLAERFFRQFYGAQQQSKENLGTGIIVDPRGYILTNEHVISNAAWIEVTLADGTTASGEVWATEPSLDIAVIKIEADRVLPYLEMGRSDDLMIGEPVVVIGNPLGLGHTCSTGIVSSLHRTVQVESGNRIYKDLVQIDAAVNPGNSGGPVLNIRGQLIGITSALPVDSSAQGIGFAIPIDRARAVVEDLIKYRYVPTGWLGLSVEDMAEAELKYGMDGGTGVFVSRVEDDSPAVQNFKAGDVITGWDGATVNDLADFVARARALRPGQKAVLARGRENKKKDVDITAAAFPEKLADDWAWFHLGIRVGEGRVQARTRDGRIVTRTGVFIEGIAGNSPAQAGGLAVGDLLLRLNREDIGGKQDFARAVAQIRARPNAFMIFQRGGLPLPLWVTIPFRMSGERW